MKEITGGFYLIGTLVTKILAVVVAMAVTTAIMSYCYNECQVVLANNASSRLNYHLFHRSTNRNSIND